MGIVRHTGVGAKNADDRTDGWSGRVCFVHGVRKIKTEEEFRWLMVRYERIRIGDGMIWKKEKRIRGGWRGV